MLGLFVVEHQYGLPSEDAMKILSPALVFFFNHPKWTLEDAMSRQCCASEEEFEFARAANKELKTINKSK
jgi:hypothetical protein